MSGTPNPRLKQIMESLVRHLHDFAREVDLTPQEWLEGITFLTAVGPEMHVSPGVHSAERYAGLQLADQRAA